ncbi:MAG: MFS transporter, partial [Pyrinomonadaceae bacterium]
LSQVFKTRKKIIITFIILLAIISAIQLTAFNASSTFFYFMYFALGIASGYWAVFMMNASEQFGTNLRSTVTTTAPNFVRGSVILMTTSFQLIGRWYGDLIAAAMVGGICILLALMAALSLKETYGKDLDYTESIESLRDFFRLIRT